MRTRRYEWREAVVEEGSWVSNAASIAEGT